MNHNPLLIPAIISVGILGIFAIFLGIGTASERLKRILLTITAGCFFFAFGFFLIQLRLEHQQTFMQRIGGLSMNIRPLSSLNAGLYTVVETYRETTGDYLVLLSPASGYSFDSGEIIVEMSQLGKALIMVNIGRQPPPRYHNPEKSGNGLVQIIYDKEGHPALNNVVLPN